MVPIIRARKVSYRASQKETGTRTILFPKWPGRSTGVCYRGLYGRHEVLAV